MKKVNPSGGMKKYWIYIEFSDPKYPDYEDYCIAEDKEEASKFFADRLNAGKGDSWQPEKIVKYIKEEHG